MPVLLRLFKSFKMAAVLFACVFVFGKANVFQSLAYPSHLFGRKLCCVKLNFYI